MHHSQIPCFSWSKTRNPSAVALIATVFVGVPLAHAQQRHLDANPQSSNSRPANPPSQSRPASGNSKGPVVAGQQLSTRVIQDTTQRVPFGVMAVPASWKFDGRLDWNYAHVELPVIFYFHAENPANEEAVFGYPQEAYYELNPPDRFTPIGQNTLGYTHLPPMPPLQTLVRFIQRTRRDVGGLKFEGYKELPGLPKAMKADQYKQDRPPTGLGIKVSYALNGRPVEEEFYAVSIINTVPYNGPQGRNYEIYWGTTALFSFRAPSGTLDHRRPVFAAIVKSFRPNPAWQARDQAIQKYLNEEFNRNLQRGYAQIAAAAALSKQISANNDAMLANIDRQLAQSRNYSAPGGGRSPAEKFDDYIRGVDTLDDPYYGTTQLSNQHQFHWTDGFGTYRSTNDPNYNPNQSEVGQLDPHDSHSLTDPGLAAAVALINRFKTGNMRSLATKLSDLSLEQTVRPKPLFRHALAWAYVFVTLSEDDDRRLEPGPFDAELTEVVALIEAEQPMKVSRVPLKSMRTRP